jgi:hypothetical protein
MEKRTQWLIVMVLVAQLLVMAIAPAAAESDAPAGAYHPESLTLDSETVHDIAVLGERMQGYLSLSKAGTLVLGELDSAAPNVSDDYVANYKQALAYINRAIQQGLFTVDEDFQVSWPAEADAAAGMAAPDMAEPDWYAYPAGHGMYVNFSYQDVRRFLPRYGLSTALSLASYSGRPWISTPYTYHFTYHRIYSYYHRYAYSCCGGVWSYVPWSYLGYYYGHYYPTYRYVFFWYPHARYWYYHWCYW